MPGIRPVMIPAEIPVIVAKSIWMNILCGVGGTAAIKGDKPIRTRTSPGKVSPGRRPGAIPGYATTPLHNTNF